MPAAGNPRRVLPPSSLGLPPLLAGVWLGLFLSRFWYELDPIRFGFFGDWPGATVLSVVGALFLFAQWRLVLRRLIAPDAMLSVHVPLMLLAVYIFWPDVDLRLAAIILIASIGLAAAIGLRAFAARPMLFRADPATLHRLAPIALALIVFGIYLRTLGTHVGRADTFEFQVVAPTLGIAHPTGYPLFVMVARLFSLLPIGSMAFRVNLLSAVFATTATVVLYGLVVRLTGRRLVAFIAAQAFAVSGVMWSQAVVAEVYALNVLIAVAVLALLIDWTRKPLPFSPSPPLSIPAHGWGKKIGVLFLLLGLGLSHHLTTILLLPAVTLAILIVRPRLPIRTTLAALGLFLLGLSMWLYLPLRWPALHGGLPMPLDEFVDWITGARFGGALVLSAWSDPERWRIVARFLLEAFGPLGAALSAVGLIGLVLRHWRTALITFVVFAAYVFYGLVYFVPDVSVFIIPAYLIMAIWIGAGAAFLIEAVLTTRALRYAAPQQSTSSLRVLGVNSQSMSALLLAACLLLPVDLLHRNLPIVDQRGAGERAEAWGRYVLSLPIPDGAAILVDSEKIAPLYYLQVTEHLRPDLSILVLGTEEEYRRQLDTRLAQRQPVYLARFLPNIPYPMRSLGPLVEVSNRRTIQLTNQLTNPPTHRFASQHAFGGTIELLSASVEAGNPARVTFEWRAMTDARPDYYVRLRLVDAGGRVGWEDAGTHPVNGYYPTGAWAKGEVVADYHEIEFNPGMPPGAYRLQVGLFPPFRDDGLMTDQGALWLDVAELTAPETTAPPLDRTLRQIYGGRVAVTSVASVGGVPRSSQAEVRMNLAYIGSESGMLRAVLNGETSDVPRSSGVRQVALDFRTPDQDGTVPLRLGFVDASGVPLPAKCGWLVPQSLDCPLGALQVSGEAIAGAVNFDNQVLLTNGSIDRTELRPGETIDVQLNWRGLKTWDADYTVFVHLLGPDGKVHGQVDAWPGQGTRPTSTWNAGETVGDLYAVTLPPGAPGGRYQIEVGWYLLATLRRLPVIDAAGRPSGDRFIVGEFSVP